MASTVAETIGDAWTSAKRALSSAPPNDAYLPWDAEGVETVQPDEEEKAGKIADTMNKMQEHNLDKHRHAFRATHVKTQGLVKGKLTVLPDLPEHLRQGIFAEPGKTYDVAARYANEPVFLQDDKAPGPRGMAFRVFGVDGESLSGAGRANTQDFFFNNAPMIELTDIDTCLDIMQLREKYFDSPTMLSAQLKLRTDALKQNAPAMLPNVNIISNAMFTQSAFRYGKWYGHVGMFPVNEDMKAKSDQVKSDASHEVLSEWLTEHFESGGAKYEIKIQLGTSPEHHPTEDASIVWDEATSPYQTIGTIEFPPQDSFSAKRRTFWEEKMHLSPWGGLASHRPLGSINRLRKIVYRRSKERRESLNNAETTQVTSIDEIP